MSTKSQQNLPKKFLPLIFSLVFIATLAILVSQTKKSGYHITYIATPSMRRGFYLIIPAKKFARYDIVEFIPPTKILNFVKKNRWVPPSGLIIKYVLAVPDDQVCIHNREVWINDKKVCARHKYYDQNKLLPQTNFCGKLKKNQYLLISTEKERSFDSRYFGVVSSQNILGRAIPIFTFI